MNNLVKSTLAGGMTTAAGVTGNPMLTIVASLAAPAASEVMVDVAYRTLSELQSTRLINSCKVIVNKIQSKIRQGRLLRRDGQMSIIDGEKSKQILEGILLGLSNEFEQKKQDSYSNFFTNVCFDQRIIFEHAIFLTRLLQQLSYRQLVIIALADKTPLQVGNWQFKFKDSHNAMLQDYADFYCEIQNLEQLRILEEISQGFSLGGSAGPLRLSLLGKTIVNELDLTSISNEEVNFVSKIISAINHA